HRRLRRDAAVVVLQLRLERDIRRRPGHGWLLVEVGITQAATAAQLQQRDHAVDGLAIGAGDRDGNRLDALAHPLGQYRLVRQPVLVEAGRLVVVWRPLEPGARLGDA